MIIAVLKDNKYEMPNNVVIVKLEKVILDVLLLNCGKLILSTLFEVMTFRSIFQLNLSLSD